MQLRLLVGLVSMLFACKSAPPRLAPAQQRAATLDVAGFEPPFEQVPVARAFIARHRIAKISVHELEPGTTLARSSEITEYNADGAPVRRYARSGPEAPVLVEHVTYTQDDVPPAAPATPEQIEKVVVLDRTGRIAKVRMLRGSTSVTETYAYDAAGRLVRIARESRGESAASSQEELRTYDAGRLIKRTRGEVSAAPFETLELRYDAQGRLAEWRGAKPGFGDDRYFFTYDPSGQLASMRFQEGEKRIYQRNYTYDADGFLLRIELKSSVPAMNDETFVLAYELANGQARRSIEVTVPAPPRRKTDADVLAALRRVFPAATSGSVQWGDTGNGRFLEAITFQLPAALLERATPEQLKDKACALRKALGFEGCDCEYLELGSTRAAVTLVTFHAMLGC
jgi:YD repeat-containing protein